MKRVWILIISIGISFHPILCNAWNAITHERMTAHTSNILRNSQLPLSYSRLAHKSCYKIPQYPRIADPKTGDVELTNWSPEIYDNWMWLKFNDASYAQDIAYLGDMLKDDTLLLWLSKNGDIHGDDRNHIIAIASIFVHPIVTELLLDWYNDNTEPQVGLGLKEDPFELTENLIVSSNWPDHYSTFEGNRDNIYYGWNVLDHCWSHIPGGSDYFGQLPDRIEEYYNWAVNSWYDNKIQGLRWLGRACHLMEDANYPPHGFSHTLLGLYALRHLFSTGILDNAADSWWGNYYYRYDDILDIQFDVSDKAEADLIYAADLKGYCDGIDPSWWNLWQATKDDIDHVLWATMPRSANNTSALIGKFLNEVGYLGEPLPWIANITENSLDINWRDNSRGETEFEIWRKESEDGDSVRVGIIPSTFPDGEGGVYLWQDVEPSVDRGQPYWYKILAKNAGRESDFSETISATVLWLNPVTGLTVIPISYKKATLSWTDNSNYESKYRIEPVDFIFENEEPGTGNSVTTTIDVLEPDTPYEISVRALDSENHESPVVVKRKILCIGIEKIVVKPLNTGLHVSWEKPNVPFSTQTVVVRKEESKSIDWDPVDGIEYTVGEEVSPGIVVVYNGNEAEFIDDGLENYITYCYKAFPYDEDIIYAKGDIDDAFPSPISLSLSDPRVGIGDNNSQNIIVDQDGVIHMVYAAPGERDYGGCESEIWYVNSLDGGDNWSEPFCLTAEDLEPGTYIYPTLTVTPDGTICVVWVKYLQLLGKTGEDELYFAYNQLDGSWHTEYLGMPGGHINPPSIAVDTDAMLHIAADINVPPPVGINEWVCYLGYSSFDISEPDINFPQNIIAYHDNFDSGPTNYNYWNFSSPAIAVVDNVPHIVWGETNHYYVYEEWGTNSWIYHASGSDWDVINTIDAYGVRSPSLAVSPDGLLNAVWIKESYPFEVRLSRFDGSSWSDFESVGPISDYSYPVVTVSSSSDIFVVWAHDIDEESAVVCRRKHIGQWDNTTFNLTKTLSRNHFPHITLLNEDGYHHLCGVWAFSNSSPYSLTFWRDTPPKIAVSLPENANQGGKWRPGWTLMIEWEAKDHFGLQSQEVWLATSTGDDIQKIVDSEIGQSSYNWEIDAGVGNYRIKLKVWDNFGNMGEGLSEDFSISDEHVFNPSFEEGLACWTPYGDGDIDVLPDGQQGVYSLYISRDEATGKYFGVYQEKIPCQPNTTYWLTGWIKTNLISGSARIALGVWSPYHHHSDFGNITGNTEWTYVYGSWTSGLDEDTLQITLYGNPEFDGFAYFDDIQLIEDNADPSISGLYLCGDLESGETVTIGCNASDDVGVDMVQFFYVTNPCGSCMPIGSIAPRKKQGTFSLDWLIPSTVPVGKRCFIIGVAYDPYGHTMEEMTSEMEFIDNHPPDLSLVSPNEPTNYDIGDTIGIEWEASDNNQIEYIKVFITRNYGDAEVLWEDIVALPGTDTIFNWAVNTPSSNRCRVKVIAYDKGGNQGEDISNFNFTIADMTPPEVTVLYPNGGEHLEIGESYDVTVFASDNVWVDSIRVWFHPDFGVPPNGYTPSLLPTIYPDAKEGEFYTTLLIPDYLPRDNCRVYARAFDEAGNQKADTSDNNFFICYLTSTLAEATAYNNSRKLAMHSPAKIFMVFSSSDGIYTSMSSNDGETWTKKSLVYSGEYPSLAIDEYGERNMVWISDNSLYFKKTGGKGTGDGEIDPLKVILTESDHIFSPPAIGVSSDDTAHVVVEVYTDPEIMPFFWDLKYGKFAIDNPDAVVWEVLDSCRLGGGGEMQLITSPSIDLNGSGNPHIVWRKHRGDYAREIYYTTRTEDSWMEPFNVSESPEVNSDHPFVEVSNEMIYIVWDEDGEIMLREGDLSTGPIDPSINISNSSHYSTSPQILDGVVIVWEEGREIFESVRKESGWGGGVNISNTSQDSKHPQNALESSEGILSVVWTEGDTSPYEIKSEQINILPPLPPQGLSGVWEYIGRDKADITLNWNPNFESDISGYYIYRSTSSNGSFSNVGTAAVLDTPVFVDRVYAWSSYWYYVTAFNIAGNESGSSDTIRVDPEYYPGPCPFLFTWNGSEFVEDNNILAGSGQGEIVTDPYKLIQSLIETEPPRRYKLEIREEETEHSFFDMVILKTIDHPQDVEIGINVEDEIIPVSTAYTPVSAISGGEDYADVLNGDITWFEGCAGDTMVVEFGIIDEVDDKELWLESDRNGYPISIEIERDGWEYVTSVFPRNNFSQIPIVSLSEFIDDEEALALRLIWFADHNLKTIRIVQPEDELIVETTSPLVLAIHSQLGNVKQELLNEDEEYAEVIPGDTLRLEFAVTGQTPGCMRDFVFVSNGYYTTETGGGGAQTMDSKVPKVFSLSQNCPNPFFGETIINYTLPRETRVSLKIYDVSGRVVTTLVDEPQNAGYYGLKWKGVGSSDRKVAAGVYFIRMEASDYRKTKKIILLR